MGRVRSLDRVSFRSNRPDGVFVKGKILRPTIVSTGYAHVRLQKNAFEKDKKVHRLVAEAFIPNPENKPQVNHKDGVRANNNVDNLEWVTNRENNIHAWRVLGRTVSEETKIKMVLGRRNARLRRDRHVDEEVKKKSNYRKVICLDNKTVYPSLASAARDVGACRSSIGAVCRGKRRTARGYKWAYYEEERK